MSMTALQLNAQIYQSLSVIAEHESLLKQAATYLKKLAAKSETTDDTLMTKDEFFACVDRGQEQIKEGMCHTFHDKASMNAWLNSL